MTYIYQTINKSQFMDAFRGWDTYKDKYSYEGLSALYDYYMDTISEPFELDVVAIACDWTEYDSIEEVIAEYSDIENFGDLSEKTTAIELDNGHILAINY